MQLAQKLGALLGLALLSLTAAAQAQTTYTFTGTEDSGPQRLFRDSNPSNAAAPKSFPGTVNETTFFKTFTFIAPVSTSSIFSVAVTAFNAETFYSVYDTSFSLADLAQNYLGDSGKSSATVFSILATPGESLVLVLNTINDDRGTSTFTTTFSAAVPEASTTVSFGLLLALGLGGLIVAAKKKKSAAA